MINAQEWDSSHNPSIMFELLDEIASERKLRLFAVACCRRIWSLILKLNEPRCVKAVEVAERFADDKATVDDLTSLTAFPRLAMYAADAAFETASVPMTVDLAKLIASIAAETEAESSGYLAYKAAFPKGYDPASGRGEELERITLDAFNRALRVAEQFQSNLLRDIFGNPYHPVKLEPFYQNSVTVDLAIVIYDDKDFDRMPRLADALQVIGCTDNYLLNHCNGPGPHVRGCWALDLVLGNC